MYVRTYAQNTLKTTFILSDDEGHSFQYFHMAPILQPKSYFILHLYTLEHRTCMRSSENSAIVVNVRTNLCYLICLRHLIGSMAVASLIFSLKNNLLPFNARTRY